MKRLVNQLKNRKKSIDSVVEGLKDKKQEAPTTGTLKQLSLDILYQEGRAAELDSVIRMLEQEIE